jgi:hypothetical protein
MDVNNEVTNHMFIQRTDNLASSVSNSASDYPKCSYVRLTSVVFLNSTETEGLIEGHAIRIPHTGAEVKLVQFATTWP